MERCIQSANISSPCLMCGTRVEKMHRPMFHRGSFCPRCCPVCVPAAAAAAVSATVPEAVAAIGLVPRTAKSPAQGATQWKDGGWGPRADDPWYHDRERRDSRPSWIPPRPNWFKK